MNESYTYITDQSNIILNSLFICVLLLMTDVYRLKKQMSKTNEKVDLLNRHIFTISQTVDIYILETETETTL